MPVNSETNAAQGQTTLLEGNAPEGVYASLFEKINLKPVTGMKICFPARKANGEQYATVDDMMQPLCQEPHGCWLTDAISLDTWKKSAKSFYDQLIGKLEIEESWANSALNKVTS